jgi:eukaryotic-like serine/threonine-protein kinase
LSISSDSLPETQDQPSAAFFAELGRATTTDTLVSAQVAVVLEKMADERRSGKGRPAEEWLAEHPVLAKVPECAVRIVYEEFCLREERGERIDPEEFYRRFPQWRDELAVAIECHSLLRFDGEPANFPQPGEALGELRLQSELGRGAIGRVFLATQPSLSDRPLAVKLTPRRGEEHLSLARLQHTNIVPLFLVQDFPDVNLRAICMPYLGGASWGAILKGMQEIPPAERGGKHVVHQLSSAQNLAGSASGAAGPAITFLSQASYVDVVCWIGACLADALYYAHQRGLVHLDLKPTNVLLSADGQPMLLDFHIACAVEHLQDQTIERLGGTPGYMSPEQRAAAEGIRCGKPLTQTLDGRSDIYSLGVVLYESLTGQATPGNPAKLRWKLQRANPRVSRGLADILSKCLAVDPAERYGDAGQLATDLRCHLASLPLRGVSNRSLTERWQKWRRRKPYAVSLVAVTLAAALIVAFVGGLFYRDRIHTGEILLEQSKRELANNAFDSAIARARGGAAVLRFFPWEVGLRNELKEQTEKAERAKTKAALHEFVEQLRFLDGRSSSDSNLVKAAAGCNELWLIRERLAASAEPPADGSPAKLDDQLQRDLTDLAILSAALDMQLAPAGGVEQARKDAIRRLEEAKEICGDSPWSDLEIRQYASPEAPISVASLPNASNSWEHYALGRWLMRQGKLAEAKSQFQAAIDRAPEEFWPQYQLMRCCFEMKQFDQALIAASVCVALAPGHAECFYNRAMCQESLNHFAEARSDFESALARGANPGNVYYRLACLSVAQHDTAKAREWLGKSLAADSSNAAACALQAELAAKAK